ncbi:hypothetical protein [Microtetraspora malaysiensis]|uniref:hypothetical protein n=1 Tax=Microtetraspora malaysiensis TaxID=161358 RepID=UPI003D8A6036
MTPLLVIASTPAASADPSGVAQQNDSSADSQTGPVELLGAATETTRYWRYPDGHVTTEMWPRPVRVQKSGAGDSGGPVFTIRPETGNVIAKGIISGGSIDRETEKRPTNNCRIWFTDIRNVVKAFGGDITKRN